MGLKGHDTRDIFPDFRTYVFPPVSPAWFQPKAWAIGDLWVAVVGFLVDSNATFITDNVQVADAVYIISPLPRAATVVAVMSETQLGVTFPPPIDQHNPLYKIGHGPPHTIQTLAQIVGVRAQTYHTLHHGKLWTGAHIPDWNTDETGEVYVISHDTGKALWLDGEITMPIANPEDPDLITLDMNIGTYHATYPDAPPLTYPPGLEPGGSARLLLIEQHGSLIEAHNSKKAN